MASGEQTASKRSVSPRDFAYVASVARAGLPQAMEHFSCHCPAVQRPSRYMSREQVRILSYGHIQNDGFANFAFVSSGFEDSLIGQPEARHHVACVYDQLSRRGDEIIVDLVVVGRNQDRVIFADARLIQNL